MRKGRAVGEGNKNSLAGQQGFRDGLFFFFFTPSEHVRSCRLLHGEDRTLSFVCHAVATDRASFASLAVSASAWSCALLRKDGGAGGNAAR